MAISLAGLSERAPAPAGDDDLWLPCSAKSPWFARELLGGLLARVEGGERFADAGRLLLSELVLNAVRHGTRRDQLVWVRLEVDCVRLVIEVHDASRAEPVMREAGLEEEHGRGLVLVNALAQEWGCRPRPVGFGKIVWCVVPPERGGC